MDTYSQNSHSEANQYEMNIQLREKVRAQAERLRSLEKYKELCELRIREIAPAHPMPILESHVGKTIPPHADEIHSLKLEISRLERQIKSDSENPDDYATQCQTLKKEKSLLEDGLRAEVSVSEEQRTYIEVLKQALEQYMNTSGFKGTVDTFTEQLLNKETNRDLQQDSRFKRLNEQLNLKVKECEALIRNKHENEREMAKASQALRYAEEGIHEKNDVLELLREQENKCNDLRKELQDAYQTIEILKQSRETDSKRSASENSLTAQCLSLQKDNRKMTGTIAELRTHLGTLEEQCNRVINEKESLQREFNLKLQEGFSQSTGEYQTRVEELRSELQEAWECNDRLKLKVGESTSPSRSPPKENRLLEEQIKKIQLNLNSERNTNRLYVEQNNSLKAKIDDLSCSLNYANQNISTLEALTRDQEQEINTLHSENTELKSTVRIRDQDYSSILLSLDTMNDKESAFISKVTQLITSFLRSNQLMAKTERDPELKTLNPVSDWISSALQSTQECLDSSTSQLTNSQYEITLLSHEKEELRDREKVITSQLELLTQQFKSTREESHRKQEQFRHSLDSSIVQNTTLKQSIFEMETQNMNLQKKLHSLSSSYGEKSSDYNLLVEENALLLREKQEIQNMLAQLQEASHSSRLQNVYAELMKNTSDINLLAKQRTQVSNKLNKSDRQNYSGVHTLKEQLGEIDTQIHSGKSKEVFLEQEIRRLQGSGNENPQARVKKYS